MICNFRVVVTICAQRYHGLRPAVNRMSAEHSSGPSWSRPWRSWASTGPRAACTSRSPRPAQGPRPSSRAAPACRGRRRTRRSRSLERRGLVSSVLGRVNRYVPIPADEGLPQLLVQLEERRQAAARREQEMARRLAELLPRPPEAAAAAAERRLHGGDLRPRAAHGDARADDGRGDRRDPAHEPAPVPRPAPALEPRGDRGAAPRHVRCGRSTRPRAPAGSPSMGAARSRPAARCACCRRCA